MAEEDWLLDLPTLCTILSPTAPQLWWACQRTLAVSVGRGALALGTRWPLVSEPLAVPPLCLAGTVSSDSSHAAALGSGAAASASGVAAGAGPGKAPVGTGTQQITLDLAGMPAALGGGAACDASAWPEFHNGVASGLQLSGVEGDGCDAAGAPSGGTLPGLAAAADAGRGSGGGGAGGGVGGGDGARARRVHAALRWCAVQRPDQPGYSHAGLLLALGLNGHLRQLAWTDLYRSGQCVGAKCG